MSSPHPRSSEHDTLEGARGRVRDHAVAGTCALRACCHAAGRDGWAALAAARGRARPSADFLGGDVGKAPKRSPAGARCCASTVAPLPQPSSGSSADIWSRWLIPKWSSSATDFPWVLAPAIPAGFFFFGERRARRRRARKGRAPNPARWRVAPRVWGVGGDAQTARTAPIPTPNPKNSLFRRRGRRADAERRHGQRTPPADEGATLAALEDAAAALRALAAAPCAACRRAAARATDAEQRAARARADAAARGDRRDGGRARRRRRAREGGGAQGARGGARARDRARVGRAPRAIRARRRRAAARRAQGGQRGGRRGELGARPRGEEETTRETTQENTRRRARARGSRRAARARARAETLSARARRAARSLRRRVFSSPCRRGARARLARR